MVTTDRQFALATANYLWSYFFGSGIVDPPDAWDLDRVDPANPPSGDWPLQNANPELLEQAGRSPDRQQLPPQAAHPPDRVAATPTSNRAAIPDQWKPAFARYFARYEARRLSAEQMFDSHDHRHPHRAADVDHLRAWCATRTSCPIRPSPPPIPASSTS